MVYKIPMEDVKSLAKAFSQLESGKWLENMFKGIECFKVFGILLNPCFLFAAKQNFTFEEYNFSQSTLEQVG